VTLPAIDDQSTLVRTRLAWHTVAEHVVAPARYRVEGRIGLRATPAGYGTPVFGEQQQIRVAGNDLVHTHRADSTTTPLTTVGAAASFLGIDPGAPHEVYTPTTPLEPDAPLEIDAAAAHALGAWFALGAGALETMRSAARDADDPSLVQLWPEHFDLALEIGDGSRGARGTFGASPGDAKHSEPYLYVTHWAEVADDPFWSDAAFGGASLGYRDLLGARDPAHAAGSFFRQGQELLNRGD
jgi:hypothetical protein